MLEVAEQGRDTPGVFLDVAVLAQGVWSVHGAAQAESAGPGSHWFLCSLGSSEGLKLC